MGWMNGTGWSTGAGGWNNAVTGSPVLYTYNFLTSPSMPSGLSLSRSTVGTNFNSSGTLVTAAIDAARFENTYNGSVWSAAGLLVEAQATNQIGTNDDLYNGGFVNQDDTLTLSGTVTDPAGNFVTSMIENTAASTNHGMLVHPLGITTFTASCLVKITGSGSKRYFSTGTNGSGSAVNAYAVFDPTNGAVTLTGAGAAQAYAVNCGNGFWRFVLTVVSPGINFYEGFQLVVNGSGPVDGFGRDTYTGDGVSGLYLARPQMEAGLYASSIIYTHGAAGTRSADLLSATGTLATQLAAGPSVWELTDLATNTTSRTSFAAGTFTFPADKLYRSFGVYPSGANTAPYLTVGGPY